MWSVAHNKDISTDVSNPITSELQYRKKTFDSDRFLLFFLLALHDVKVYFPAVSI